MRGKLPPPGVMPVNRREWAKKIGLSNFINAYYQYKDIQTIGACKKVLIVGSGQGLDRIVLEWRGLEVTTVDIDSELKPDYTASVHDLGMFHAGHFDVIIASHVLEHFAAPYLDLALKEMARVARYAIIYLPVYGKHIQWRFLTGSRRVDLSFILDFYNYFERPSGVRPRYMAGQHFWEVGMRGFRVKDMKKRFSTFFQVLFTYRNKDWLPSINFVLKSKVLHGK